MGRMIAAAFGAQILGSSIALAAAAPADNEAGGLPEVLVTAQRREESEQRVGIALSVLSGDSLAAKAITHVDDLQNALPSLQVEPAFGSGLPQYRIRGVGFLDYTSNNASPVGLSLDEVAFALPIESQGQLFDLDRIEVLRGPQGTLYGRNTTGGEIKFVTRRPSAQTEAGVSAQYGSHNEFSGEAYLSGGLAEHLSARLSAATEQGGAWQYDRSSGASLGAKDEYSLRAQLLWDPDKALNVRLVGHFADDKSDETGLHLIAPYHPYDAGAGGQIIPADTSRYAAGWNLDPAFARVTGLASDAKPGLDNGNDGAALTANYDAQVVKFVSISAFNRMIRREYGDWDATQYHDSDEYFRSNLDVYSQELRVESTGAQALAWVTGVFYSGQRLAENFYSDFSDANIGFRPGTRPLVVLLRYDQNVHSFGEFAQANYAFTDQWKITLGAREDHETRDLKNLNTGVVVGPQLASFTGTQALGASTTSNLPSGKLELGYSPISNALVYASVSRGVKSGGFTAHNTTKTEQIDPFEPERLTAYEIGEKADLTPALRVNAAAFYYQYRDQQILGKVFDELSGSFIGRFTNANARLHGGELEAQWQPTRALSLSQYLGFVEGHYTSTLLNGDMPKPVNYDGRPESIPKWSYGGDATYIWQLHGFNVSAEGNYSFHDTYSQFFLLDSNDFTIPRYWLANANLSVSPAAGGPWTASLWGRNIFNRSYDVTRNFFLPGTEVAQAGEPATFGIRLSYNY